MEPGRTVSMLKISVEGTQGIGDGGEGERDSGEGRRTRERRRRCRRGWRAVKDGKPVYGSICRLSSFSSFYHRPSRTS